MLLMTNCEVQGDIIGDNGLNKLTGLELQMFVCQLKVHRI